jgi:hypothetical protein
MNLRVSVSRVEEFRKVCTTEWAKESLLVNEILDPKPLGWQARYGEALHACIENLEKTRQEDGSHAFTDREGNVWTWPASIVKPCADAWPKGCIFERRAEWTYDVRGHRVTVAGRSDSVLGLLVVEGKTRFGLVEPTDYSASLQWQFYLDMLPWAKCVEYRIHEIGGMYADKRTGDMRLSSPAWLCDCETDGGRPRERRKEPATEKCDDCGGAFLLKPGGPWLEHIHVFRCWREPRIARNVRKWLEEFVGWAESRDLLSHLVNRWAA